MPKSVKIALLSHRFGNIGHLFMSVGFEEIVREMFGANAEITHFEQHHFFSIYPQRNLLHLLDKIPHGRMSTLRMWLNSPAMCDKLWPQAQQLKEFSSAITCGGPSIVRGAGATPEMCLMFHHQLGAFHHHGVPTFDCGVGSGGFPIKSLPPTPSVAFDNTDKEYFSRLFSYSTVSTVRDRYAESLWNALGRDPMLIPCGAIASGRRFERLATRPSSESDCHIIINYQRQGANNDWGQRVDINRWRRTVVELIGRLKKRHKVIFLCHGEGEARQAAQVGVDIPIFTPNTLDEYAKIIMGGKAGLASRIHAAIPMAGVGLPVFGVGTDTRLGTLELMGMRTGYVDDVSAEQLEHELEAGLNNSDVVRENMIQMREQTVACYQAMLRQHMRHQ
jgi:hypothetical protein